MSREFKIYFFVILGLFAALFFWLLSWPANAQTLCGPRREVIDALKSSANETEVWSGKHSGNEPLVMLLLSGKSGSWTLIAVKPDVACVIAAGMNSTPMFGDPA
jgi:hypothetical protein